MRFAMRRPVVALGVVALLGGVALMMVPDLRPAQAQQSGGEQPPMPVTSLRVKKQPVRLWFSFSGRLTPVDSADIRPEISGRITEVRFTEGQKVKKDDILFVIDPRPYEAALAKADAGLAAARTNASLARTELTRAQGLLNSQTIPRRQYDERVNADRVAQSAVTIAEAERRQAALNLDYAYIKAPFDGRVGRAEMTVGNLVQVNGPTQPLLTTLVAEDNIYADFEIDEQTFINQIRPQSAEKLTHIPVELFLRDGGNQIASGTIHAFDNRINTQSGTIRARARLANDGRLLAGMFVTVRVAGIEQPAITVPERAIGTDQNRKFVYVITAENKITYRPIVPGGLAGDRRVVTDGLAEGEQIVIDGLQHVRPDMVVAPAEQGA